MDDPLSKSIIDTIIQAADRRGLTQKALAEAAGVSRENLTRIKQRGSARLDVLERLAHGVGLRVVAVPVDGELDARPVTRNQRRARGNTFRERHPELVWSNSKASDRVFVQRALLDPRFDTLLDAAVEFGPDMVEREWSALLRDPSREVHRAAPVTEHILGNIRRGYEQASC